MPSALHFTHLARLTFATLIALLFAGSCYRPATTPTVDHLLPLEVALNQESPTPDSLPPTLEVSVEPPSLPPVTSATLALPLAPAPTSTTPDQPLHGIEIHHQRDLDVVAQAGVTWVRRNALLWSLVEPLEGSRSWGQVAALESELEEMSRLGLQAILIVRSTPAWAQKVPGYACGPVKTESLEAFGRFLTNAVERYSQPPYNVSYWELGNEPDVPYAITPPDLMFGCWGDPESAYYGGEYYAEMLKIAYPAIKRADPQAQVLIGGLLLDCDPLNPPETQPGSGQPKDCAISRFLEGILVNAGGDYFDGVSFHAYDYYYGVEGQYGNANWHTAWDQDGPALLPKSKYILDILAAYEVDGKFLFNTESALLCGRDGTEPACLAAEFERTKAYYAVQVFTLAQVAGIRGNIWYSLTGWRGSQLLDSSNLALPVYTALQFNAAYLHGAAFWGELDTYPGVKVYQFRAPGKRFWTLWASDGLGHSILLPVEPDAVFDAYGNAINPNLEIQLSMAPVYIEWVEPP